ncbi:cation-transporting P-type ATPase [Algoriphagus persicinus]|uniref:cation-transporting P-type ATPase n=1 Tax=Algoriphagus persicinus TaxID=3108754 RepID=UPI002B3E2689|nr:cation-transporting P-type ATPase [Algoriphagus sp. E1-3-M2]MEB2785266.1 cation-transporting P-type ATPase [Algoriphagus sp. E1-3-M2]
MNYHLISNSEIYQLLNTSKDGLHKSLAEERLKEFGKNELIEKKKKSIWLIFFNQFKDVMIIVLLVAAVVAFAI